MLLEYILMTTFMQANTDLYKCLLSTYDEPLLRLMILRMYMGSHWLEYIFIYSHASAKYKYATITYIYPSVQFFCTAMDTHRKTVYRCRYAEMAMYRMHHSEYKRTIVHDERQEMYTEEKRISIGHGTSTRRQPEHSGATEKIQKGTETASKMSTYHSRWHHDLYESFQILITILILLLFLDIFVCSSLVCIMPLHVFHRIAFECLLFTILMPTRLSFPTYEWLLIADLR